MQRILTPQVPFLVCVEVVECPSVQASALPLKCTPRRDSVMVVFSNDFSVRKKDFHFIHSYLFVVLNVPVLFIFYSYFTLCFLSI